MTRIALLVILSYILQTFLGISASCGKLGGVDVGLKGTLAGSSTATVTRTRALNNAYKFFILSDKFRLYLGNKQPLLAVTSNASYL